VFRGGESLRVRNPARVDCSCALERPLKCEQNSGGLASARLTCISIGSRLVRSILRLRLGVYCVATGIENENPRGVGYGNVRHPL
jgi:hypothetical protein